MSNSRRIVAEEIISNFNVSDAIMTADKLRIISRAWSDLYNMLDDADLRKADLSLTDYSECNRLMALLGTPGNTAETIIKRAADYFSEHGYTVTESGNGFQITV